MTTIHTYLTKNSIVSLAVIFLVTFGIYWNALQGDFIWDDRGIILDQTGYPLSRGDARRD